MEERQTRKIENKNTALLRAHKEKVVPKVWTQKWLMKSYYIFRFFFFFGSDIEEWITTNNIDYFIVCIKSHKRAGDISGRANTGIWHGFLGFLLFFPPLNGQITQPNPTTLHLEWDGICVSIFLKKLRFQMKSVITLIIIK